MKKKNEMNENLWLNFKRTWKYIKRCRGWLVGYGIVSITLTIISIIIPLYSAKIILNITDGVIEQLLITAVIVCALNLLRDVARYFKMFFFQRIHNKTIIALQKELAGEILNLRVEEIDKNSSGLFINRLTNDAQEISNVFTSYTSSLASILSNFGILVTVFIFNKYIFLYSVLAMFVLFFLNRCSLLKQFQLQKKLRGLNETKTGLIGEVVRGMRDIKVLNANETILKQTTNKIDEIANVRMRELNIRRFYDLIYNFFNIIFDLGFIVLGCILYKESLLTIPAFIIAYNYYPRMKSFLSTLVVISEDNKNFNLAANRVYEILENDTFKKEVFGDKYIKKLEGNIKFDNVNFAYDKKKVLNNISFEIKPNERVAFVGKSGVGKTTIFNLITRLYVQNSGTILLDNYDIKDLSCSSIRDNMSIITQNPYIFNFSIKDNLLLAKENASMKEIRKACKLACIDDYIMSLPDKYDTMLGENGVILSGGQKQRLAIARALLMKTEIILFDEATSALDNETQSKIKEAIDNLKGEYTILIVAHRLSTIIDCDRIFVLDKGKIIDSGNHKQLLKRCGFYKSLYEKDLIK